MFFGVLSVFECFGCFLGVECFRVLTECFRWF